MTATEEARCTCGHRVTDHELTQAGRRSYCFSCGCERYERVAHLPAGETTP